MQATSTLTALPPKSVGGGLEPPALVGGAAGCRALLDAALSQRWRKRVTSSCSSIVFMCLGRKRGALFVAGRRILKGETVAIQHKKNLELQLTWRCHWRTSSSGRSCPGTSSSHRSGPAAPAGTSSGALWLAPASAAQEGGAYQSAGGRRGLRLSHQQIKDGSYLLLSQLQVGTGLVCEEPDAGHGSSHVILSQ